MYQVRWNDGDRCRLVIVLAGGAETQVAAIDAAEQDIRKDVRFRVFGSAMMRRRLDALAQLRRRIPKG